MTGIKFVIDEKGEKSAVVIDLKKHSKLWEDFYDVLKSKSREDEPRESLKQVKNKLKRLGKLKG
jgi:hypothetical protein